MHKFATILLFLGLLAGGCGPEEPRDTPKKVIETPTSGKAHIVCDSSIYPLMAPVFAMYDSAYPQASVTVEALDSRECIVRLLAGETRGAILARGYLPDEDSLMRKAGLEPHESLLLARDALVFYTGPQNPLVALDKEQLVAALLDAKFDAAREFGGLESKPVFVVPGHRSSEYANLKMRVCDNRDPIAPLVFVPDTDSAKTLVRSKKNYIGVGYLSQLAHDSTLNMLRIGFHDSTGTYIYPKLVHQTRIVAGMYPFPIEIRGYLLQDMRNLPWGFIIYLARDNQVQLYYRDAGIVPGYAKFRLIVPE